MNKLQNKRIRHKVLPLATAALVWMLGAYFSGAMPVAAQAQPASAVKLSDFAGSWIIMTAFNSSGNSSVMRLRVVNNRITGGTAGSAGKLELSRLHGRILRGHVTVGRQKIPMSAELSSDKGQLILITAPPASEYDVAVAWRQGYKPRM